MHDKFPVFGCNSTAVADKWRKTIVDFHNALRRNVAKGFQKTIDSKLMPYAKDMHELSWDCELEKIAKSQVCNPDGIPPKYDDHYDVIILDSNVISDIGVQTRAVLRKWTKGAEIIDLSDKPKFDPLMIGGFGRMVYAKSTRIGCSMDYCNGRGMLMCVYNKKVNKDDLLYEKARVPRKICTGCPASTQCVNYLCKAK
ncbi:hypothetical protein Aduo_000133 [Ancylostoma duodenale]